jgi:tetratricopeptide (TPR) repeat protein
MARLNQTDQSAPVVHVLAGMSGVGKTELVAAYARGRMAAAWRLVAWINAWNTGNLLAGLAAVADAVGLSDGGYERGTVDAGEAVRHWLEADGGACLLVFDDAEDPDALRPFLPVIGAARVLITTARESVTDLGIVVPVHPFSGEEAVALLDGRTGLADEAGAAAVAAELGYLPLALDQAAAAMSGQRMGYRAYLGRLNALQVREYPIRGEELPYPPGVLEAVLLSLEILRADDRTGLTAGVLEVVAVLSAAGVRRELLRAAGEAGALARGIQVAAEQVDQTLAQLAEQAVLSLSIDGQAVFMHRLMARVIRDELTQRSQLGAVCQATASALETYAKTLAGGRDRASVRDVLKQMTALLENMTESGDEADEELARSLFRLRLLALHRLIELGGSMPQAIAVGEHLTADLEWTLGPDHPDTLNAMNGLATAYRAAGLTAEAIALFEQALVGRVRQLGSDHPDTLTTQTNLAAAYQAAGRAVEGILMFRLALAASERLYGADHRTTSTLRGNLAAAYRNAGRISEVIPLLEQTLVSREGLLGSDHPDTLTTQSNLATAYKAAGRIAEAIPLVEQILAFRERAFGTDHPKTLGSRNNLAEAYREVGRAAEAIPLFEKTLATCEQLLGADDPRTQATRHNLALARQEASLDE